MKFSLLLVKHLVELGLDKKHLEQSTYVESEVASFLNEKMIAGDIDVAKVKELNAPEGTKAAKALINEALAPQNEAIATLTKTVSMLADIVAKGVKIGTDGATATGANLGVAGAVLTGEGDTKTAEQVRVKAASERFNKQRSSLTYSDSKSEYSKKEMRGQPIEIKGDAGHRVLERPSEWDHAVAGSWLKHMANRDCRANGRSVPAFLKMSELDNAIVKEAVETSKFIGPVGNQDETSGEATYNLKSEHLNDYCKKNLLDESGASQGLEAVPIEFDSVAILTPLLHSELLPLIDFKTTSRRRIEGFSMANPTFGTTAEGTNISYFNTDAFIAAFDTTVYPVTSAIRVGLDFSSDSPVDIGGLLDTVFGQAYLNKMDNLIAYGTGSSEMLGLTATSGLVAVSSANGSGGAATVGDYESLMFGVKKEYRQQAGKRAVFLANDVTYRRARAIPVGSSDARRVFGMDEQSYMLLDQPFKVNHGIANTKAGFFCLNRYRAYRRAGYNVRVVTEDQDLALSNRMAVVVRARVGGQMDKGAAGSLCTDMTT